MIPIDPTSTTEKNKQANKPVFLYTIHDYDGASSNLCLTEYDTDVVYDGVTYTKFPIQHESVSENATGEIDSVKVTVSNVTRLIQSYLEDYDFRGKKVTISLVWSNQLADTAAHLDDVFYIDNYAANQSSVEFTLTGKFDVLSIVLPGRLYTRNHCRWVFKSTECGYAGGETTCDKTKTRCKVLDNYVRFGAFPAIPVGRVFIG